MDRRGHNFTLVEIMVVVAIMVLVTTLAVVRVRDSSASVRFDNALRDFRNFALKARVRALELGVEQAFYWVPDERCFRVASALSPSGDDEGETSYYSLAAPEELMRHFRRSDYADELAAARGERLNPLQWTLPEEFDVAGAEDAALSDGGAGEVELFRFLGSGGGMGGGKLVLRLGERRVTVSWSPVTGLIALDEGEGEEE